mgnify:CR=1 FL=1
MAKIKGTVVIDKERCKGCDLCVVACPVQVLALAGEVNGKGYNYSQMVRPDDCIGCASCPKGLLALSKTRLNQKGHAPVELTEPDKCVGCAFCATMCPDCVITVEK